MRSEVRWGAAALMVGLCTAGCGAEMVGGDAGEPDGGAADGGALDAAAGDAGSPDAGSPDGGPPDAGPPDAGPPQRELLCAACGEHADCGPGAACASLTDGTMACVRRCNPDLPDCPRSFRCVVDVGSGIADAVCLPVGTACCVDEDGDGHGLGVGCAGPDCDDAASGAHPGADEVCDGVDQDCDEIVDERPHDCAPARCEAGVAGDEATAAAECVGGACAAPAATSCGAFRCDGDACGAACADDADCVDEAHCDAGACVGDGTPGAPCLEARECADGLFCVDGVCCTGACDGVCERCDGAGACVAVADGDDPDAECGAVACAGYYDGFDAGDDRCFDRADVADGSCGGARACRDAATECGLSARAAVQIDCDDACQEPTAGTCVDTSPGACTDLDSAADTVSCGVGACARTVPRCAGGAPSACVAGAPSPEVCDGVDQDCDGPIDEAPSDCAPASCTPGAGGDSATAASACVAGGCTSPVAMSCGLYRCAGDACGTGCAGDADCASGAHCDGGACVLDLGPGGGCSETRECASGLLCVDGVCCTEACDGVCERCDASGACAPAPDGTDVDGDCGSVSCAGYYDGFDPGQDQCFERNDVADGTCDGARACRDTPTECGRSSRGAVQIDCDDACQEPTGGTCVDTTAGACTDLDSPTDTVTCGIGACERTVPRCAGGAPNACTPGAPRPEVCGNAVDEDCDGEVGGPADLFRLPVDLVNPSADDLFAGAVRVVITDAAVLGHISDPAGIRVYDAPVADPYGAPYAGLPFHVETSTPTELVLWIGADVAARSSRTVQLYYGRSAPDVSDPGSVFVFFEPFDDVASVGPWTFRTNLTVGTRQHRLDTSVVHSPPSGFVDELVVNNIGCQSNRFGYSDRTVALPAPGRYLYAFHARSTGCGGCTIEHRLFVDGVLRVQTNAPTGPMVYRELSRVDSGGDHTLTVGVHTTSICNGGFRAYTDDLLIARTVDPGPTSAHDPSMEVEVGCAAP